MTPSCPAKNLSASMASSSLARMTPIERAAFVLRHQEGRSIEEICAALSLNVSGAKQAIFRAVRKLRAALEAPGEPA